MPFVDISNLRVTERLPGWFGGYFHSPSMTFAHYDFVRGSSIHEHCHPQEEVYEVIEGELEVTIDGGARLLLLRDPVADVLDLVETEAAYFRARRTQAACSKGAGA